MIGYESLLKDSKYPIFKFSGIPEIHDVWISEEYRGHGFGKQLIFHLERLSQKENYQSIGLGVGLYKDYGRAQRLYTQLGYVLARISHKILKKSDEMLCEMHRECARDHYQVDKARAIRGEDRMTLFEFFESL